jgi:hypothetical protein
VIIGVSITRNVYPGKKGKKKKKEKKEKKVNNETVHLLKLPLPLRRGRKTYFSLLFNFLKF